MCDGCVFLMIQTSEVISECSLEQPKSIKWFLNHYCLVVYSFAYVTPPGSAPSHRAGLEPGIPAREAGALPRRLKAKPLASVARAPLFEVRRVRFTHRPYWHTHLLHMHVKIKISEPHKQHSHKKQSRPYIVCKKKRSCHAWWLRELNPTPSKSF